MEHIKCNRCLEGELLEYMKDSVRCNVCGYIFSHDTYIYKDAGGSG